MVKYIKDCTQVPPTQPDPSHHTLLTLLSLQTFGKAKLVLKDNKFFVESQFPEVS